MQHKSAHCQQRAYAIIIATAATVRNIRLIIETIIMSHTGIEIHIEHTVQGTQPHHGFSLLISVEFVYVEHYPRVCCTR